MPCELCSIEDESLLITQTNSWRVFLCSDDHRYLGRCTLILRRHTNSLSELTSQEWEEFERLVNILESALKKAFSPDSFNWSSLGNRTPHTHWHMRPRYSRSITFAEALFVDELFGKHYTNEKIAYPQEVQSQIVEKIRHSLS